LDEKLIVLNDSFSNIANFKNEVDKEYKKFLKNQNPETLKDIKYFLTTTRDKITYGVENVNEFLNETAQEAEEKYNNFINSAVNIDNKYKTIEKEKKLENQMESTKANSPQQIKFEIGKIKQLLENKDESKATFDALYKANEYLDNMMTHGERNFDISQVKLSDSQIKEQIKKLTDKINTKIENYENKSYRIQNAFDSLIEDIPRIEEVNGRLTLKNIDSDKLNILKEQYEIYIKNKIKQLDASARVKAEVEKMSIPYEKSKKQKEKIIPQESNFVGLLDIFKEKYNTYYNDIEAALQTKDNKNVKNSFDSLYQTISAILTSIDTQARGKKEKDAEGNIIQVVEGNKDLAELFRHTTKNFYFSNEDVKDTNSRARQNPDGVRIEEQPIKTDIGNKSYKIVDEFGKQIGEIKKTQGNLYTNLVQFRSDLGTMYKQFTASIKGKTKITTHVDKIKEKYEEKNDKGETKIKEPYKMQLDNLYNQIQQAVNEKITTVEQEDKIKLQNVLNESEKKYNSINKSYENSLIGSGNDWIEDEYYKVIVDFENKLKYINTVGNYNKQESSEPNQNQNEIGI
jgi:hypothetical protein